MWDAFQRFTKDAYNKIDGAVGGVLPGGVENKSDLNLTEVALQGVVNSPVPAVGRAALNVAGQVAPGMFGPVADAGENAIRAVTGDRRHRSPSEFTSTTRSKLADAIDKALPDQTMMKDKDGFTQVDYPHYNKDGGTHKGPIAYVGGRVWGRKNDDGTYELRSDENYDFNAGVQQGNKEYKDNLDSATMDAVGRGDVIAALSSLPDHLAYHTGAGTKGFNIGGKFSRPDTEGIISEPQARPTPPAQETTDVSNLAKAYEIQQGDTLTAIAKEFGLSIDEIAKKNNISNINNISVGQQLNL